MLRTATDATMGKGASHVQFPLENPQADGCPVEDLRRGGFLHRLSAKVTYSGRFKDFLKSFGKKSSDAKCTFPVSTKLRTFL